MSKKNAKASKENKKRQPNDIEAHIRAAVDEMMRKLHNDAHAAAESVDATFDKEYREVYELTFADNVQSLLTNLVTEIVRLRQAATVEDEQLAALIALDKRVLQLFEKGQS
jgi:hypothetical protein